MVNRKIAGPENAGRVIITSSSDGMEVAQLSTSNKDMDYYNLDKISTKAIYNRYNVPLPLISDDASTYSNYENSLPYFYYNTILPTADIIFNNLSKLLCPRYGLDPRRHVITYDANKIEVLAKYGLEQLKMRKDIGIETTNELRAGMAKDAVDGGDSIILPANSVRLEDLEKDTFKGL